jgi:uncharacterized membrane protein
MTLCLEMKKKVIRTLVWWVVVLGLLALSIYLMLGSRDLSKNSNERFMAWAYSMRDNEAQWEGIEIAGEIPIVFHKDLLVTSSLATSFAHGAIYSLWALILILCTTAISKRLKRDTTKT